MYLIPNAFRSQGRMISFLSQENYSALKFTLIPDDKPRYHSDRSRGIEKNQIDSCMVLKPGGIYPRE